jgi:hypothetical protein
LSHAGRFGDKTTQEQSAKATKTQGGNTLLKTSVSKVLISSTPQTSSAKKDTYVASPSTQRPADQPVDDKEKGTAAAEDKEILADPSNLDKKL